MDNAIVYLLTTHYLAYITIVIIVSTIFIHLSTTLQQAFILLFWFWYTKHSMDFRANLTTGLFANDIAY